MNFNEALNNALTHEFDRVKTPTCDRDVALASARQVLYLWNDVFSRAGHDCAFVSSQDAAHPDETTVTFVAAVGEDKDTGKVSKATATFDIVAFKSSVLIGQPCGRMEE